MHKVVIERPRWNPGRSKNGRRANLPDELLPKVEGIRRPHVRRKGLTDLLGPLKRWLQSQVGRPWNDVYSQACAVIKPDSIIRAHVKTHLLQFVQRDTLMHDGKVCALETGYGGRGIVPVEELSGRCRNLFFVHPETGLLQIVPQLSRRIFKAHQPKMPITLRWIARNIALQQIRGLWYECHFEAVPVNVRFRAYDHALERIVIRNDLPRHQGHYLRCNFKRQLSKHELRKRTLVNTPPENPSATASRPNLGRFAIALRFIRRFFYTASFVSEA